MWFDDRAAMDRGNASPEAKRLHDDGALFIGGIKSFIVEEKVIIPISGCWHEPALGGGHES